MPASPSTARAINDRLALRLLQSEGPLTAGQLKELTGLSRPSVADLVERLTAQGLIEVVGEAAPSAEAPTPNSTGSSPGSPISPRSTSAPRASPSPSPTSWAPSSPRRPRPSATRRAPAPPSNGPSPWSSAPRRRRAPSPCTPWESAPPASSTPSPVNSVTRRACPSGTAASSPPSTNACRPASWWRTRPTSPPSPNSATAPPATATRSPCSGWATASAPRSSSTASCAAGLRRHRRDRFPARAGHGRTPVRDRVRRRLPLAGRIRRRRRTRPRPRPGGPDGRSGEPAAAALVREAVRAEPGTPAACFLDALADRLVLGAASVVAVLDPGCLVLGGEVGRAGGDRLATLVATRLAAMSPLPTEVRAGVLGGAAVLRGALLMARDGAQDDLFAPTDR